MKQIARWMFVLACMTALLCIAVAGQAKAVGIPGIEVCPKNAPFAATPDSGLAGMLGERPIQITTDNDPKHIWSTGGFAGMRSHTYDLGCAVDPTSYARVINANTGSSVANAFLSVGDGMVALTDSIDRRAWQPGWILGFLSGLSTSALGSINAVILLPYLGLALILATVMMLWRAHDGKYSRVALNVGWIIAALTIASLILLIPLAASKAGQGIGGVAISTLYDGKNPSDSVTNQIVENVEYQGFLRRNFGGQKSTLGEKYGPELLASTRVSWAEMDAINALPADKQADARKALTDKKADQFKAIAAKIKDADPTAYLYLTGGQMGTLETVVEVMFLFFACISRLAVAVLAIACVIVLTILSIGWVFLLPAIVLPGTGRFDGRALGMTMINGAQKAMLYVAEAALTTWVFNLYLKACIAPGMNLGWSLLLLILGSVVAWMIIAPVKKLKSILTLGKADGTSYVANLAKSLLATSLIGSVGGLFAARSINKHEDEQEQQQDRLSEAEVVHATIYTPTAPFVPERPTTVDAEPITGSVVGALPMYERPAPEAPPPTAESPYIPYERSDDNEGANR